MMMLLTSFFEAEESYYQDAPELPDGTFYEETIDDAENIYDTEEFDEVYSTYYVDAKTEVQPTSPKPRILPSGGCC